MQKTFVRVTGAVVIAALAFDATFFDRSTRTTLAVIVGIPSLILMLMSRRHLGRSFSVMPEAKGLVTTGMYSRIQHPMYLFLDLFLAGLIVLAGIPVLLVVWALIVVIQLLQSGREEKILSSAFGDKYESYRKRTWF